MTPSMRFKARDSVAPAQRGKINRTSLFLSCPHTKIKPSNLKPKPFHFKNKKYTFISEGQKILLWAQFALLSSLPRLFVNLVAEIVRH